MTQKRKDQQNNSEAISSKDGKPVKDTVKGWRNRLIENFHNGEEIDGIDKSPANKTIRKSPPRKSRSKATPPRKPR